MNNKTLNTIGNVMQIGAGLVLVSSFFVEDNKKAVHRRWVAVGVFAAGWGIQIAANKNVFKLSSK